MTPILAQPGPTASYRRKRIGRSKTTVIKKGASIGSGATILANVTVGENAIVGAGQRGNEETYQRMRLSREIQRVCCE